MNTQQDYHIHTNYNDHSDPDLTIENVLTQAKRKNLKSIAITEHVRKSSEWVYDYVEEIEHQRKYSDIKVVIGFEAKILLDGTIDCLENLARDFFIIASFHSIFANKKLWLNALKIAIDNKNVDVLGHLAPEKSFQLYDHEIEELGDLISKNNKIVELNAKYHRPPKKWVNILLKKNVRFHLGSDAHSLGEIGRFDCIMDLIQLIDKYNNNNKLI